MAAEASPLQNLAVKSVKNGVPTACRQGFLSDDDKRIYNEHLSWLQGIQENAPVWSPWKYFNCMGQERHITSTKEKNYDIEIPKRLYSLWGNPQTQTEVAEKMQKFQGYQMVNNVLACCVCLKYNLNQWSSLLLDDIVKNGSKIYKEVKKKIDLSKEEFQFNNLNHEKYEMDGTQFKALLHQVASGFLYMPYGRNEFNLARALMWFFRTYQFGLLRCQQRCVAFGFAVDMDHGFFMYDCQSVGTPLFEADQRNSYVLRTNHLQILLYCLIVALNVSKENEPFWLYSVDVQMLDPKEGVKAKKPILKLPLKNRVTKFDKTINQENGTKAKNGNKNLETRISGIQKSKVSLVKSSTTANNIATRKSSNGLPNDYNFWQISQTVIDDKSPAAVKKRRLPHRAKAEMPLHNPSNSKNTSVEAIPSTVRGVGSQFKKTKKNKPEN